jgi:hypothetical protein
MAKEQTTEQVTTPPNPSGKGGFADHPENRNPGGWKKEGSISYQYNRLMRMTPDEIRLFKAETVAQKIALARITEALKVGGLSETKEITDRTEGKAPQYIGTGDPSEAKRSLVEFIGFDPSDDIEQ